MNYFCPGCRQFHTVGQRAGVIIATAAVSSVFGGAATRHPIGAIAAFVIGMKLGEEIDRVIARECPECGEFLQLVAGAV